MISRELTQEEFDLIRELSLYFHETHGVELAHNRLALVYCKFRHDYECIPCPYALCEYIKDAICLKKGLVS